MNKFLKAAMCAGLCGTMVFAAACNTKSGDKTETRPLYLALGATDGNYNPFFYTSLNDGQVVSMTQSALITTETRKNAAGNDEVYAVAGENYPTVAKDFTIKYFTPEGNETNDSSAAANGGTTEYEFLIKKGMKFSNGSEITIKDVLFNFYVYLDPAYTGSNTMYSVDIQGLLAYQENDANLSDGEGGQSYLDEAAADLRIQKIIDWAKKEGNVTENDIKDDKAKAEELFKEELNTDWTSNSTSWVTNYETNYNFQYTWQAYLFMEGQIFIQQEADGSGRSYDIRVDANGNKLDPSSEEYKMGKNLTTLDPWHDAAISDPNNDHVLERGAQHIIDRIEEATSATKIAEYKASHEGSTDEQAYEELSRESAIAYLYDNYTSREGIQYVVTIWNTARELYNYLVADEHGKRTANSEVPMYYISGLQTRKVTSFKGVELGEEYDVFKIVINDVDPAAIWQFGVSIAPLYYYSGTWKGKNYVTSFNGHLNGGKGTNDENTCFGLERDNIDFITDVLRNTNKAGVPMGAGAYMAADDSGRAATTRSQFDNNNIINYVRNPYFETMGEGIQNAKIRTLRYRVLDEDKIIASLEAGEIDYGEPNATPTNYTRVTEGEYASRFGIVKYPTNGYGYVGINAGKVPDVNVRRVIMGVMDTASALRYYQTLAQKIFRSMSVNSWAYPNVNTLPDSIPSYSDSAAIRTYLVNECGYTYSGGKLSHPTYGTLKYTFTIAGATSDHPAYQMFLDAADILTEAGFEVKVSTDPNALSQLTRGGLEVWAAAWSAGVDPDMYQVWHKDSNATSVLNWGYDVIKKDQTKYSYEWNIIEQLSKQIEAARSTTDQNERTEIYADCLDLAMDLAVELPIYQRNDLCVYNKTVINPASLNQNYNCYLSLINNIWEVTYL